MWSPRSRRLMQWRVAFRQHAQVIAGAMDCPRKFTPPWSGIFDELAQRTPSGTLRLASTTT
jgi:hypothetical protein